MLIDDYLEKNIKISSNWDFEPFINCKKQFNFQFKQGENYNVAKMVFESFDLNSENYTDLVKFLKVTDKKEEIEKTKLLILKFKVGRDEDFNNLVLKSNYQLENNFKEFMDKFKQFQHYFNECDSLKLIVSNDKQDTQYEIFLIEKDDSIKVEAKYIASGKEYPHIPGNSEILNPHVVFSNVLEELYNDKYVEFNTKTHFFSQTENELYINSIIDNNEKTYNINTNYHTQVSFENCEQINKNVKNNIDKINIKCKTNDGLDYSVNKNDLMVIQKRDDGKYTVLLNKVDKKISCLKNMSENVKIPNDLKEKVIEIYNNTKDIGFYQKEIQKSKIDKQIDEFLNNIKNIQNSPKIKTNPKNDLNNNDNNDNNPFLEKMEEIKKRIEQREKEQNNISM